MTTTDKLSLQNLMQDTLTEDSFLVRGAKGLYMEVTDTSTGQVWMCSSAVSHGDYDALVVEAPLVKSGAGEASMDAAAFRHSPGAPTSPVRERVIGEHHFINVARADSVTPPTKPNGPMDVVVDKAHTLGFEEGRTLRILTLPDGDYVEVIGEPDNDASRVLPEGAELKHVTLTDPLIVELPTPTRAFFWGFGGGELRSFQGPVTL